MPNLTKESLAEFGNKRFLEGYNNGHENGIEEGRKRANEEYRNSLAKEKLEQVRAVTALIAEQTKMMSRTGYLLAQLSEKKGW